MNYTQTIRNYISERKGEFFEITYERKKYFHMIPDKTLMKVLNRLEDEGLLLSIAKGLYFINDDNKVLDRNYYVVSQLQKSFVGQIFIKFYKTITVNRGYFNYSQKMTNSFVQGFETISVQSESSNSSESVSTIDVNYYNVGKYYKQYRTDDQVVFAISNLLQNTYFSLKVVDIYNISNDRIQTVSYSIKKIQSL